MLAQSARLAARLRSARCASAALLCCLLSLLALGRLVFRAPGRPSAAPRPGGGHADADELGQVRLGVNRTGALLAAGAQGDAPAAPFGKFRALQWNPYFRCFKDGHCSSGATQALTQLLRSDLDFASVILLKVYPFYTPPPGWSFYMTRCGKDQTTLFYSVEFWAPVGTPIMGCFVQGETQEKDDRPFIVQGFKTGNLGIRLVVVSANFPHTDEWGFLRDAIASVTAAVGTSNVLLLASTKTNSSSAEVFRNLSIANPEGVRSVDLYPTCCNDVRGFVQLFDRVISNFGTVMHTDLLFEPLPHWAHKPPGNKFSKGLIGSLFMY